MAPQARLQLRQIAPESNQALAAFGAAAADGAIKAGVEEEIVHFLNIRISQINACAFCIDMHTIDARAAGVSEQRIYLLSGWDHATGIYSDRERAALEFAEAITRLEQSGVGDEVYARVREAFTEEQVGHLIFLSTAMNAWNRIAVSARMVPGHYRRREA
ncbi:MAG TPA: carboxymuconolactone decarboxylase family protein [Actinocrinis sp.]|nr:carboxymuconolactone decarboxylase family protein [Actinocrinis sp.]